MVIIMDKETIKEAIRKLKEATKKRKFTQSIDLIVNLRNLNLKKPDEQVDFFLTLPNPIGKKRKVCAIVGPELYEDAKKICDKVIHIDELDSYKDKKREAKKMAREYDFFVAQANIMPRVAGVLGRILGPKGKMPNPKAGGIIPPKANIASVYDKFQKTIHLVAKSNPTVQTIIGTEDQDESILVDNIWYALDNLVHHLPKEKHNVKEILLKMTMGKPVQVKH